MTGYTATAEPLPGGCYLVRVHPGAGGRIGDPYVAVCTVLPRWEDSGDDNTFHRVAWVEGFVLEQGHDAAEKVRGARAVRDLLRSLGFAATRYERRKPVRGVECRR